MQDQYKMVNDTDNNYPALEQQNKHKSSSTINHMTQELHDTDTLKERLKHIFDRNYQYYIER